MSSSDRIGHAPTPLRIGVLDNDTLALDSIVRMLESQSRGLRRRVTVWSTTSPAYAIQECRTPGSPTDALLIDMALNGVTGPQVAAEILKRSPGTVIIGMTSYNLDTYRGAAARAGIATLLDKAAFGPGLLRAIEAVVGGRDGRADDDRTDRIGGIRGDARNGAGAAFGSPPPDGSARSASAADGAETVPLDSSAPPAPQAPPSESRSASFSGRRAATSPFPKPLTETERTIVLLSLSPLSTKQIGARMGIAADTVSSHRRNIKRKLGVGTWFEALDYCRSVHIV